MDALAEGGAAATEGSLADLFSDNGQGVTLSSTGSTVELPIDFGETPVDMSQIVIAAPENGGPERGSALVEYEDGSTQQLEFDSAMPTGVQALSRGEGTRTITIELGKRVPVKKVTISVEKTADGYVSVETIQFLEDIVPENPVAPNRVVKGLAATAADGSVSLKWRELPNITGYRVSYWQDGQEGTQNVRTLVASVPYATVPGLENLKTYWFQVTPTAEGWEGDPCDPVSATPQPAKKPDAPDMVSVSELEGALGVSWKASKSATYYEVYYKEKSSTGSYQQVGGSLSATRTTITNLKNGVPYQLYVVAGNDVGKSGPSRIAEGTPKAVDYGAPDGLPVASLLDKGKISAIRLGAPGNYAAGEYTADKPFKPENMIDGDYRTHWTASTSWSRDEHVVCFGPPGWTATTPNTCVPIASRSGMKGKT